MGSGGLDATLAERREGLFRPPSGLRYSHRRRKISTKHVPKRTKMTDRISILTIAAVLITTQGACAQESLRVTKISEKQVPVPATIQPRVNYGYFDAENNLEWNDDPVLQTSQRIQADGLHREDNEQATCQRTTFMLNPRVDQDLCTTRLNSGSAQLDTSLIGLDETSRITWKRSLGFESGSTTTRRALIAANPRGLVLSDLEVWSPDTGETIFPAPTYQVTEDKQHGKYSRLGSALYDQDTSVFFLFDAEVSLLRREGGLYRLDPRTDEKTLLHQVATTPLGGYVEIEEMALTEETDYLLLARRLSIRGPGWVSFSVFDLKRRRMVFDERHGEGHMCVQPRMRLGKEGNMAFWYRDETLQKHVLVHYLLTRPDSATK